MLNLQNNPFALRTHISMREFGLGLLCVRVFAFFSLLLPLSLSFSSWTSLISNPNGFWKTLLKASSSFNWVYRKLGIGWLFILSESQVYFLWRLKIVLGKKKKTRLTQKPNTEKKTPMDNLPGTAGLRFLNILASCWKNLCSWNMHLCLLYGTDGCGMKCPLSYTLSLRWSCEKEKLNVREERSITQGTNPDKPRQQIKPSCLKPNLLVSSGMFLHRHPSSLLLFFIGLFFIPRESCKLLPRWMRVCHHFMSWLDADDSMSKEEEPGRTWKTSVRSSSAQS